MTPEEIAKKLLVEAKRSPDPELYIVAAMSTMEKTGFDVIAIRAVIQDSGLDIAKLTKLTNDAREL